MGVSVSLDIYQGIGRDEKCLTETVTVGISATGHDGGESNGGELHFGGR